MQSRSSPRRPGLASGLVLVAASLASSLVQAAPEPSTAPARRRVVVVADAAIHGIAPAPLVTFARQIGDALSSRGLEVVRAAGAAPSCAGAPRCLADAARTAGAELAAGLSGAKTSARVEKGKGQLVELMLVEAVSGEALARALQPVPPARAKPAQFAQLAAHLVDDVSPALAPRAVQAASGQPSTDPATARPSPPTSGDAAPQLLAKAQAAYEAMDYDAAGALATQALASGGLDPEARLDAYVVQASSLAITADPGAAEVAFRLLLRARPSFQLPASSSPKILGVFQKVQTEERVIAEQVRQVQRNHLVEKLQLFNDPPSSARGGRPLPFAFRLHDPGAAVTAFELPFRRQGEPSYSMLALQRDPEGTWRGAIPADWTASAKGFVLEYYLATRDADGPLLTRGGPQSPLKIDVSAGQVERSWAKPVPRSLMWTGVVATAVAAVATGGVGLAAANARSDYSAYVDKGQTALIDGRLLLSKRSTAAGLTDAAIGTAIGAGVLAVATLILVPFTKSEPEPSSEGSAP